MIASSSDRVLQGGNGARAGRGPEEGADLRIGDEQRVRPELANSIGYGHFAAEHWNVHSIRVLGGSSNVWKE